jgi:hypothetical protein
MDNLTQAYAHLDYNSKIASAGAMSWIDNTTLGQSSENDGSEKPDSTGKNRVKSKHSGKHYLKNGKK